MAKKIIGIILLTISAIANARFHHHEDQVKKGFLALPASQQIGPLYAFGQNIVDKGSLQAFVEPLSVIGCNQRLTQIKPSILYGFTNEFSIFVELPFDHYRADECRTAGADDLLVQFEYAFFDVDKVDSNNQATLIAAFRLPTGDDHSLAVLPTGFNSTSFFIAATANHLGVDWYLFTSYGGILTTEKDQTKYGNTLLYQFGVGRSLGYHPNKIFAAMLEWFGVFQQRNKIAGAIDVNSGGNTVLIAPSLWFSTERFIFQVGIAFVVYEKDFGQQNANFFIPSVNFGWKF